MIRYKTATQEKTPKKRSRQKTADGGRGALGAAIGEAKPVRQQKGRGRPSSEKELISIRLDPDVLAAFRADGPGWQTRINDALRKHAGL